jgi:hypothetical protein
MIARWRAHFAWIAAASMRSAAIGRDTFALHIGDGERPARHLEAGPPRGSNSGDRTPWAASVNAHRQPGGTPRARGSSPSVTRRAEKGLRLDGILPTVPAQFGEPEEMSNRAIWNVRLRHVWLATPLKGKRMKKRQRVRIGLEDALLRKSKAARSDAAPAEPES